MLQLYVWPGSTKHDLPSLDAQCFGKPGEWEMIKTTDPGVSPTRQLPLLKDHHQTFVSSSILRHLLQSSSSLVDSTEAVQRSEGKAFEAYLDTTVLPLVLHSLYSLPKNWHAFSRVLAPSFSYPLRLIRPAQLREQAHDLVDATQPTWWNLGGQAEKEEEKERRAKKVLLASGTEGVRERKEEQRKEGKERIKKKFGESKVRKVHGIIAAAQKVFGSLEHTLASSSTPYFFSSTTPSPLDAQLCSLLSLILYLPLPSPILADLINSSFPRLWAHTALLRRTLWSERPAPILAPTSATTPLSVLSNLGGLLIPTHLPWSSPRVFHGASEGGGKKKTKNEVEFERKRWIFLGVVAVAVVGWGLGTGKVPLPWGWGWSGEEEEEEEEGEYEWVVVEEVEGVGEVE
ncbi:BZ3500_MvSof-1268-A1-R1_Chr8-1g09828 [Microbotryum saponariae]|uniref:BZ3500_MvSof-1268-A1-R1_Chr8-1g09828 protein n=1 Tax=Microbotryum saponariae TaxID=289078 RepID=A0A2X0LLU3_9BASI|nr:BZ3500_MvSof-1268-A1-R1_Chr8-1g09828 [Microbotryum saponariae]SDA08114.1 BZ3501_MvSof-1269-A2-R1_Chr8-1g09551 [Microbotryum saponariae]